MLTDAIRRELNNDKISVYNNTFPFPKISSSKSSYLVGGVEVVWYVSLHTIRAIVVEGSPGDCIVMTLATVQLP